MRFGRLDLNLLVALDVLLAEKNVTISADRLCLSQSAMSGALGRLRDYFNDELLINTGRRMVLTSRAESLVIPVRNVLLQIKSTITTTPEFNPEETDRHVRMTMSDYALAVLLTGAIDEIARRAPGMTIEILPIGDRPVSQLDSREIDLLITIDQAVSDDHPKTVLFTDDFVVLACKTNELIKGELTRELYCNLGHVNVQFGKARLPSIEEYFLKNKKIKRKTEIYAPSFTSVPPLLKNTNRIATVHRKLAKKYAELMELEIYPFPFVVPEITQVAQWHTSASEDQALMWLVNQIKEYAQNHI